MVSVPITIIEQLSTERLSKASEYTEASQATSKEKNTNSIGTNEMVNAECSVSDQFVTLVDTLRLSAESECKPQKESIQKDRKGTAFPAEIGVLAPPNDGHKKSHTGVLKDKDSTNGIIEDDVEEEVHDTTDGDPGIKSLQEEGFSRMDVGAEQANDVSISSMLQREYEQNRAFATLNSALGMHSAKVKERRASTLDRVDVLVSELVLDPGKSIDRLSNFILNTKKTRKRKAEKRRAHEIQLSHLMSTYTQSDCEMQTSQIANSTNVFHESISDGCESCYSDSSDSQSVEIASLNPSQCSSDDLPTSQTSSTLSRHKHSQRTPISHNSQKETQQAYTMQRSMSVSHASVDSIPENHMGTGQRADAFNFSTSNIRGSISSLTSSSGRVNRQTSVDTNVTLRTTHRRSSSQTGISRHMYSETGVDANVPQRRIRKNTHGRNARPRSLCLANEYAGAPSRNRRPSSIILQPQLSVQLNPPQSPLVTVKPKSMRNQPSPLVFLPSGQTQGTISQPGSSNPKYIRSSSAYGAEQSPAGIYGLQSFHAFQPQSSIDQICHQPPSAGDRVFSLPGTSRRLSLQASDRSQLNIAQFRRMSSNQQSPQLPEMHMENATMVEKASPLGYSLGSTSRGISQPSISTSMMRMNSSSMNNSFQHPSGFFPRSMSYTNLLPGSQSPDLGCGSLSDLSGVRDLSGSCHSDNKRTKPLRVSFNCIVLTAEAYGAEKYDRSKFKAKKRVFGKPKRQPCHLEIVEELLRFKILEMPVHDLSRHNTDLHMYRLQGNELLARKNLIAKIIVEKGCYRAGQRK